MKFNLAEQGHGVLALAPVDINGGGASDVFSMKQHAHATILVCLGVTGAASTITLEECDDVTPTNSTAIAFDAYKEETAGGDTLGARVATAAAGFATSTNDGVWYAIEIDADKLSDGFPYLRVAFSDPGAVTFAAIFVALSGSRYAEPESPTVLT